MRKNVHDGITSAHSLIHRLPIFFHGFAVETVSQAFVATQSMKEFGLLMRGPSYGEGSLSASVSYSVNNGYKFLLERRLAQRTSTYFDLHKDEYSKGFLILTGWSDTHGIVRLVDHPIGITELTSSLPLKDETKQRAKEFFQQALQAEPDALFPETVRRLMDEAHVFVPPEGFMWAACLDSQHASTLKIRSSSLLDGNTGDFPRSVVENFLANMLVDGIPEASFLKKPDIGYTDWIQQTTDAIIFNTAVDKLEYLRRIIGGELQSDIPVRNLLEQAGELLSADDFQGSWVHEWMLGLEKEARHAGLLERHRKIER